MDLKQIFKKHNISGNLGSFKDIKEAWESVVNECSEGYNENIYELDHDTSIRTEIDNILEDDDLKILEDYKSFSEHIDCLDKVFVSLVRFISDDNELPFWKRKYVLKQSGPIYKESVWDVYRIEL